MAKLVAFYSRADENYFGGDIKSIKVGNTEKVANMISEITIMCEKPTSLDVEWIVRNN